MIEWTFIIKTTIALIAIVDPIGCLPLFLSLTGQHKKINKKNVVKMTAITVFIILVTSLFLGDKISGSVDKYLLPIIGLIILFSLVPVAIEVIKEINTKRNLS